MLRKVPAHIVRGFLMGSADIVPGVSGGTIALVLGIYERLVGAIRTGSTALGAFVRLDGKEGMRQLRAVDWGFLLPLAAGIVLAVVSLAHLLAGLLRDYPVEMAALFLGLVVGSTVVAWKLLTRRDAARLAIIAGVGVAVFVLLGLQEGTSEETVAQLDDVALWAFFGAGAIAICAMILPGISGSFLLVMIGMYGPVLGAVTERDLLAIVALALGALVGLALFSQVLHRALTSHYDTVMAALIGLMIGSLRVLWPWPLGVESTALGAPQNGAAVVLLIALAAGALVIGIDAIGRRISGRSSADEIQELRSG